MPLAHLDIPGYQIDSVLHESARSLVLRGLRQHDLRPVVLKLYRHEHPTPTELLQLRHQFAIAAQLQDPSILQVYDLKPYRNSYVLVAEDMGGISLDRYLQQRQSRGDFPLDLEEVLSIALQLVAALEALYRQSVIHKNLQPANIAIHPERLWVKPIDFAQASILPREAQDPEIAGMFEGSPLYRSPEQTGRTNRLVDYRTDYYSLGVILYELLTGQPPFATTDPLERLYCQIAVSPPPLRSRNPTVPPMVEAIVLKLLAKDPEDRYQSPWGLHHDLQYCQEQLQQRGAIAAVPLGHQDYPDRLQIPEKLYGRDRDIACLQAAFERVRTGNSLTDESRCELVLVTGYAGIGKTTLVRQLYRSITASRGVFCTGKFEPLQRHKPYSAVLQAIDSVLRQLLTLDEPALLEWQRAIAQAVGSFLPLLQELLPNLALLLFEPPPCPVEASAAQITQGLQRLLSAFCRPERPLVLFLDDLQWADSATLTLLEQLLTVRISGPLLVVGAYRDLEVDVSHPLTATLERLDRVRVSFDTIRLEPLRPNDIGQLLADTFRPALQQPESLAALVRQKTQGNPLFVNQFLQTLYRDGDIALVRMEKAGDGMAPAVWQWLFATVQAKAVSEDVATFVQHTIGQFPPSTQQALGLAACLGNPFTLQPLAKLVGCSAAEFFRNLAIAIDAGLILPSSDPATSIEENGADKTHLLAYRFLHDRIQQAAYALLSEADRQDIHARLGLFFLEQLDESERTERVFQIVGHVNAAFASGMTGLDLQTVAQLNFVAGERSLLAAVYTEARVYFELGIRCLDTAGERSNCSSWESAYALAFKLHLGRSKSAYLDGDSSIAEAQANQLLELARTPLDRATVCNLLVQIYNAQNQLKAAIDIGLNGLELLGVHVQSHPSRNLLIDLPQLADLDGVPQMVAPASLLAMQLLTNLCTPSYAAAPDFYPVVVLKMIELFCRDGYTPPVAHAYISYGMFLCSQFRDFSRAYEAGAIAQFLVDRFPSREIEPRVNLLFQGQIRHLKVPLQKTLLPLEQTLHAGIEVQDLEFSSYCVHFYCLHIFRTATQLERAWHQQKRAIDTPSIRHSFPLHYARIWHQVTWNLMHARDRPTQLSGPIVDETTLLPQLLQSNSRVSLGAAYLAKTYLLYLFGQPERACDYATKAAAAIAGLTSTLVPWHRCLYGLALLATYRATPATDRTALLQLADDHLHQLEGWAQTSPANYGHLLALLQAERARVRDWPLEAATLYDRAIAQAQDNEYLGDCALAYELAAQFYLGRGSELIARAYLREAHYTYGRWGAVAKVRSLEQIYADRLSPLQAERGDTSQSNAPIASSELLDLETVIRVSQAIASETSLDALLETLLTLATQNTGATSASLVLCIEGQLRLQLQRLPNETAAIWRRQDLQECEALLPTSAIRYVARTQVHTIVPDVVGDCDWYREFSSDVYLQQHAPQSFLGLPLLKQQQLVGVLYLESQWVAHAFCAQRMKVLKFLASQAAIAIKTVGLYDQLKIYSQTLERKVAERTIALETANRQLHHLATIDGLTQTLNRRSFDETLEREWQRSRRQQHPLALILCDVDFFKPYNDCYGHQAGDDCLRQIAQRLHHTLKRAEDCLARYGGEEFAAILPDTDAAGAAHIANLMCQAVFDAAIPHAHSLVHGVVTVSIGVGSVIPSDINATPQHLVEDTDRALYRAKREGRNRYVVAELAL